MLQTQCLPALLLEKSWEFLADPTSEGQIFPVAGAVRDVGLSEASFLGVSHLLAAYVFATLWLWCFMGGASHWVAVLSAGSLIYWFKCSILYLEQMTQELNPMMLWGSDIFYHTEGSIKLSYCPNVFKVVLWITVVIPCREGVPWREELRVRTLWVNKAY